MGKSLEELRDAFRLWFVAFHTRFHRDLSKVELLEAIENRIRELELKELNTKICTLNIDELGLVKKLLETSELNPEPTEAVNFTLKNPLKSKKSSMVTNER